MTMTMNAATRNDPTTPSSDPSHSRTPVTWEPITEQVADWRADDLRILPDERLVQGIVLSGPVSRNGHQYTADALQQAAPLYVGKPVFLDHAASAAQPYLRSTRDLVGSVTAARFVEGRIRGDIQVLETEAGQTFLALLEGPAAAVGMSHVVLAERGSRRDLVERIHDVVSVDAVVFPATTVSLRESLQPHSTDEHGTLAQVEVLQEQLRSVKEELARLQDEWAAKETTWEIEQLLASSGLPGERITDVLREELRRADPVRRRALIAERQQWLAFPGNRGVISRPRTTSRSTWREDFVQVVRGSRVGVLER